MYYNMEPDYWGWGGGRQWPSQPPWFVLHYVYLQTIKDQVWKPSQNIGQWCNMESNPVDLLVFM